MKRNEDPEKRGYSMMYEGIVSPVAMLVAPVG